EKGSRLRERNLQSQIDWLKPRLKNKFLHMIRGTDIMSVRSARENTVRRAKGGGWQPVTPATVDLTTRLLQRVLNHAADVHDAEIKRFKWGKYFLENAKAKRKKRRKRAIPENIEAQIFAALRADYHPVTLWGAIAGLRAEELLVRWDQVDWKN